MSDVSIESPDRLPAALFESVEARNRWLDERLDGDNRLPQVDSVILDTNLAQVAGLPVPNQGDPDGGSVYVSRDGKALGSITFGYDVASRLLVVSDSGIVDDERGQGYGKRLYVEALKALPLGWNMAAHSMKIHKGDVGAEPIWQWLVSSGVAQIREPDGGQIGAYQTVM